MEINTSLLAAIADQTNPKKNLENFACKDFQISLGLVLGAKRCNRLSWRIDLKAKPNMVIIYALALRQHLSKFEASTPASYKISSATPSLDTKSRNG